MGCRAILLCALLPASCDRVFGLQTLSAGPDALTTCSSDDFSGDVLGPQWSVTVPTSPDIMISQHDALIFHYAGGAVAQKYNAATSTDVHDFTTGSVTARLVTAPELHRETDLKLVRSPTEYYGLVIRYASASDGAPHITAKTGESNVISDRLFDPARDRWFRIEIDGATARFEMSPDQITWESHEGAALFPTDALNVSFAGYVTGGANNPTPDPASDTAWDDLSVAAHDCATSP